MVLIPSLYICAIMNMRQHEQKAKDWPGLNDLYSFIHPFTPTYMQHTSQRHTHVCTVQVRDVRPIRKRLHVSTSASLKSHVYEMSPFSKSHSSRGLSCVLAKEFPTLARTYIIWSMKFLPSPGTLPKHPPTPWAVLASSVLTPSYVVGLTNQLIH